MALMTKYRKDLKRQSDTELNELKEALLFNANAMSALENQLRILVNENEALKAKLNSTESILKSKEYQLDKCLASAQEAFKTSFECVSETEAEVKELKKSLSSLNDLLWVKDRLLEERSVALANAERGIESLHEQLQQLQDQHSLNFNECNRRRKVEVDDLISELNAMDELLHERDCFVKSIQLQLDNERESATAAIDELESVKCRLYVCESQLEGIRNAVQLTQVERVDPLMISGGDRELSPDDYLESALRLLATAGRQSQLLRSSEARVKALERELETLPPRLRVDRTLDELYLTGSQPVNHFDMLTRAECSAGEIHDAVTLSSGTAMADELAAARQQLCELQDGEQYDETRIASHSADTLIMVRTMQVDLQSAAEHVEMLEASLRDTTAALRDCECRLSEREEELALAQLRLDYYRSTAMTGMTSDYSQLSIGTEKVPFAPEDGAGECPTTARSKQLELDDDRENFSLFTR